MMPFFGKLRWLMLQRNVYGKYRMVLAEEGFAEFGDAAFVDYFAPAVLAAVAEADLVAGLDFGARAYDGVGKLDEFPAYAVAAFPAAELEFAVIFEDEGSGVAGNGLAADLGFGALVAAREVDGLGVAGGQADQGKGQSHGEPERVPGKRDHKGWVGPHAVLRWPERCRGTPWIGRCDMEHVFRQLAHCQHVDTIGLIMWAVGWEAGALVGC